MQPARVQTFRREVPIIAALNSWLNILNNITGRSKAAADQKITGLHLEESTAVHSLLLHHHRLPYHTSRVPLRSVGAGSTEDRCTVRTPFYTPSDSATWSGVVPGPGMPGVSNRRPPPPACAASNFAAAKLRPANARPKETVWRANYARAPAS